MAKTNLRHDHYAIPRQVGGSINERALADFVTSSGVRVAVCSLHRRISTVQCRLMYHGVLVAIYSEDCAILDKVNR